MTACYLASCGAFADDAEACRQSIVFMMLRAASPRGLRAAAQARLPLDADDS